MSTTAWLLIAAVLLAPAPAIAQDQTSISTGRERGSYYHIGQRLKKALLLREKLLIDVRVSRGSLDNLKQLDDPSSPVGLALAQSDALSAYLQEHPNFKNEFVVLGDVGRECAFVIARRAGDGDGDGLAGLASAAGEVSVDDAESGAAVTFATIRELAPSLRSLTVSDLQTMEALVQLKAASPYSKLAAAMVVQRPRALSEPARVVLGDPEAYRLVSISQSDVGNLTLPDGSDVYSYESVSFGGKTRKGSIPVDTLCVRGFLLGSKEKLGEDLRESLASLMIESSDHVIGEDD